MKRLTFLLACFFISMGLAIAQNKQVTGIVVDEDGEPVIGASVVVKGTTTGTVTGIDGSFSFSVPASSTTVVVKYIGMQDTEAAISSNMRIQLSSSSELLDEVVVVAYGTAKKASLTGGVSVVTSDQITDIPISSFDQILQGKSSGVQVTASSGRPGAGANVRIRGVGSINASAAPLYVIDNVPVNASDFSALNPNDIESMSVLKDASATSIYGSRAANGVILVTTKKGSKGKTRFTAKAQYGITQKTQDNFEMMNTQEKLTWERQLGVGEGGKNGGLTDQEIANYPINTNWVDEIFRTGYTQIYEVSMSGGSDATKFYVSGQYYKQEGIVPSSNFERISGRVNLEHEINKYLKFGINASLGTSKEDIVRMDRNMLSPFNYAYSANPYTRPYNDDGSYATYPSWTLGLNVFENLSNNPRWDRKIKGVGAAYLEWSFLNDFKYTTVAGGDYNQIQSYQYNKPESTLSQVLGSPYGYRRDAFQYRSTFLWTNILGYEKTFNEVHELKVSAGTEAIKSHYNLFAAAAQGFTTGRVDAIDVAASPDTPGGTTTDWRMLSFFGAFNYMYNQKYIVDFSVRRDGSSRFGKDVKYGNFWAGGLGWNMSEEEFMQDIEQINRLKIRGSAGVSGNDQIGDYASQGVYSYGSYDGGSTAYPSRLPNNDLSWEKNFQYTAGLDATLFDQRFNLTFDYYYRKTKDLLLARRLSMTSGFSSRTENIGEMENKGVEIAADGDIIKTNDLTINLHANASFNKNEVIKLYKGEDITTGWNSLISEGQPLHVYKMVRWAGVNPANGDALYYDKDGNITAKYNGDDAVIIDDKTPNPKSFGSFGLTAKYKGIDLGVDFYWVYGNYVYNHISFFTLADGSGAAGSNMDKRLLYDQWLKPGDITNIPRQSASNSSYMSTRYLEDASYLRLRNVTLGYTIPKRLAESAKLSSVRVFATGANLLTFTGFTGLDPEIGTAPAGTGTGPNGSVLDFNYPASRTIMFGIEVGF